MKCDDMIDMPFRGEVRIQQVYTILSLLHSDGEVKVDALDLKFKESGIA